MKCEIVEGMVMCVSVGDFVNTGSCSWRKIWLGRGTPCFLFGVCILLADLLVWND